MSMPSFPPNGADMTREEALTMIIASIAMEELALSHILNAEGEKLQYVLGTLPGTSPCTCPQDVLTVNKSVTALVEAVTQNQMLLKNKLSQVLEFSPLPPAAVPPCRPEPSPPPPCQPCPAPSPSPCPPPHPASPKERTCETSVLQLAVRREGTLWNPDSRLTWRRRSQTGKAIRWDECASDRITLSPGKTYAVQYTLNVRAAAPAGGTGAISLKQSPCGMFTDALPLCFSMEDLLCGPQTLHMASVLHPGSNCGCETSLSLVLNARSTLCVEGAVMDIVELP